LHAYRCLLEIQAATASTIQGDRKQERFAGKRSCTDYRAHGRLEVPEIK